MTTRLHRRDHLTITNHDEAMPTFQSIGMHPELCHRLVTDNRSATSLSSSDAAAGASNGIRPVETPQALLARNPKKLRLLVQDAENNDSENRSMTTTHAIPLHLVHSLRSQVAQALLQTSTTTGPYLQSVRQSLQSSSCDSNHQPSATGSLTALELFQSYRHQVLLPPPNDSDDDHAIFLTTGCTALDEQLLLPWEYRSLTTRLNLAANNGTASTASSASSWFGRVVQWAGPPGTGKTQMALHVIASATSTSASLETWYLTSHASPALVGQRLRAMQRQASGMSSSTTTNALEQTRIASVAGGPTQVLQTLACLENEILQARLQEKAQTCQSRPRRSYLVVLDSASGCLSAGDEQTNEVAATLQRLARRHTVAVLVLNGSVAAVTTTSSSNPADAGTATNNNTPNSNKPALGRAWNQAMDVRVWMEPVVVATTEGEAPATAQYYKATTEPCHNNNNATRPCYYKITASGIQNYQDAS